MEDFSSVRSAAHDLSLDAVLHCDAADAWISLGNLVEAFVELEHIAPRWRRHPRVLSLRCRMFARAKLWNALFDCSDALTRRAPRMAEGWVWKARAASLMMDGNLGKARAILLPIAHRFRHDPAIAFELACYSARLAFPVEVNAWLGTVFGIAAERGTLAEWQARVQQSEDLKSIVGCPHRNGASTATPLATNKPKRSFFAAAARCIVLSFCFASLTSNAAVEIDATAEALRAAAEAGGDIITTNGGVITLRRPIIIQNHTTIAGAAMVTLSGGQTSRIFEIAPAASLELIDLTLIDGRDASGGAIYNDGGSFTARNCTFRNHAAIGQAAAEPGGSGYNAAGGAIFSNGRVLLAGCRFENNHVEGGTGAAGSPAQPGGHGGHSSGGAIFSAASLIISNCIFASNEATGGPGGAGAADLSNPTPVQLSPGGSAGAGIGGALSASGTCIVRSTLFSNNAAFGGPGGPGGGAGGPAGGGAIAIEEGDLLLSLAQFISNRAAAAPGAGSASPSDSEPPHGGGRGGEATGSAVYVNGGKSVIDRCTMLRNVVLGGDGFAGAEGTPLEPGGNGGGGGGVYGTVCNIGEMLLTTSTFAENVLRGGSGGAGGHGSVGGNGGNGGHSYGGGLCNMGTATLINCTIASNACWGGNGGTGGNASPISMLEDPLPGNGGSGGSAGAAAVWIDLAHDEASIDFCTLAGNEATVGAGGAAGRVEDSNGATGSDGPTGIFRGHQVGSTGMAHVRNTVFAGPPSAPQSVGTIMDLGGNLCSGGSCQFTNRSSLDNTDPGLLPLTNNGGPTLTMALRRGSRAINRAERGSILACDQRGFLRRPRTRHDIGAFETAARPGFIISGSVWDGANGLGSVMVKVGNMTAVTDATGYYELFGVGRGRRTIQPIASGLSFAPPSTRAVVRRNITIPPFAVAR